MKKKKKKAKPVVRARPRAPLNKREAPNELPVRTLLECLCAAHVASYVRSEYQDRGGIVLVGPPGVLKTSLLNVVDRVYHDAIGISDINVPTLNDLKDQIASGSIRTLVIGEMAKLYERDPRTASNLEGTLRALVAEGFRKASFEDARVSSLTARCTVLTAITPQFQVERFRKWESTGFGRRFLWPLVRMKDPHALDNAVESGQLLDFYQGLRPAGIPASGFIRDQTTLQERQEIRKWLKRQPGLGVHNLQQLLLIKMLAVFKWWYAEVGRPPRDAMQTMHLFARSLQQGGAELVL